MFQHIIQGRAGHYFLLTAVWACLSLVNLGQPSLWDIDEGHNAEAAREMYDSGNWIVPSFNYALRDHKPALLYWCQTLAYHYFGLNEFAARLPSALAALLTILLTYELGRLAFGAVTGLLAGLIVGTSILFLCAAHFANPDALLVAFSTLTFYLFWRDYERDGKTWLWAGGITTGLAMLAKGPVGLILPLGVNGLFLLWQGQLRRFRHPALLLGVLLFALVAAPWYTWVIVDTRGEFFRGFFLKHNVSRFLEPMENHRGSPAYYLLVLLAGFAPWSIFLLPGAWHVAHWRQENQGRLDDRYRFLFTWIGVYLLFFTVSRTKLPNYVLPLYPPAAVLLAHFLDRWRRGEVRPPLWMLGASVVSLALVGILSGAGMLVAGGALAPSLTRGKALPGVEDWAWLGLIPLLASVLAVICLRREARAGFIAVVAAVALLFSGPIAGFATATVDQYKAPRPLGQVLQAELTRYPRQDVQIGTYQWFQPSVVFYCQREVKRWGSEEQAVQFLEHPIPVFLFLPAREWDRLRPRVGCRELARHRDLYRGIDVVLVTNR